MWTLRDIILVLQSDWLALYAATATTLVLALDQALHQTRGAGYARLPLHTGGQSTTAEIQHGQLASG
jgi:hypothetical protein